MSPFTIDLWATRPVFLPGHRIRVEISSTNFPRFDRNLTTGEDQATGTRGQTARQTILSTTSATPRITHLGRSAVLLIGTRSPKTGAVLLTVTAATARPVQLRFDRLPSADELRRALDAAIPDSLYFDDVHGSPAYRRHLTSYFGEQIRVEIGR